MLGSSQDAQGYSQAFAWAGNAMTDLGTLGGAQSYAYAVNDAGEVVGYSWTGDDALHSFLYLNGVMIDLNSLLPMGCGWTIDGVYSINAAGDILADGVLDGQHYAVDLSEVVTDVVATPEPEALVLALGGLLTIAVLRRGSRNSRPEILP